MSDPLKLSALEELEQWGQNVGLSSSIPEPQPPVEPVTAPTPEPEAPVDPLSAWSQGVQEQLPEPVTTERPERKGALERLGDWIQEQRVGGAEPEQQLAPGFPVEQTQAFGAPPPEPPPPEPGAVPLSMDMVGEKAKGWLVDFLEATMPEDPTMARAPTEEGPLPIGPPPEGQKPIYSASGALLGYREEKPDLHPLMYASGLMQGLAEQVPETAAGMSELMAYTLDQPGSAMLPIQQQEGLSWALKKTAKVLRGGAEKHKIQREIEGTFKGIPYSEEFLEMMQQQAEGGTDLLAQIKEDPINTLLTASAQSLPVMAGMIATTAISGGTVPAAMASGILFESANSWNEARAQGKSEDESAVSAAIGGVLAGSVEGWAGGQLLKRFGLPQLKGFGKWVGDRAVDALREGGTEGFQYYLSQFGALVAEWSQNPEDLTLDQMKEQFKERILSKETARQAGAEALVGMTVGPMIGAGGSATAKIRQTRLQNALDTFSELAAEEQQRIAAAEENVPQAELLRATVEEIEGGPPPGAAAAPLVIEEEGVEEQAIEPPERPIKIPGELDRPLIESPLLSEPGGAEEYLLRDAEAAGRAGTKFELPLGASKELTEKVRKVYREAREAFLADTAEEKGGAIPREPGVEPAKAEPTQPPPAAETPQYEKSERGPIDPDKLFPSWVDRERTLPSGAATLTREEVGKLVLAPDDFQFKQEHDAKGQTRESHVRQVTSKEEWDPELARGVTVWYNPETDETYPVNGHNRVARYQDLGVTDDLEVYFINAENMKEARAVGALQNLSEGHGTVMDAATFFRDSGFSMDDIEGLNLPLHGRINSLGAGLSQTSDLAFQAVRDGTLSEAHGAVIGEMLPVYADNRTNTDDESYAGQAAILKELKKRKKKLTIDEVRALAGNVARAGTRTEVADQLTLDGYSDMITKSNFVEMAQVESYINRKLVKDKKLHGMVSEAENAAELEAHGSRIAAQESLKLSKDAATLTGLWEKFKHGYEVTPIIEEAARLLATPKAGRPVGFKTDNQVLKDAYRKARQALAATLGGELAKREVEFGEAAGVGLSVAEEAAPEPRVAPEVPEAPEPVGEPAAVRPALEEPAGAEVAPEPTLEPTFKTGDRVVGPFGKVHTVLATVETSVGTRIEVKDAADQITRFGPEELRPETPAVAPAEPVVAPIVEEAPVVAEEEIVAPAAPEPAAVEPEPERKVKTKAAPPSPEEFTLTAEQQAEQEAPRRERLEAEIARLAEQETKLKSSKYADDQATQAHAKIVQERREALENELEQEGPTQAEKEAAGQQNMFAAMEVEPEVEVAEETRQPAKSTEMALQLAELATVRMNAPAELRPLLQTIEETARDLDDPVVTFFTKHPEHKKAFDFIFGRVSGAKNYETRERAPGVGEKPGFEYVLSSINKWPTAEQLKAGAHYTLQMAGPMGVIRIEGKATGEIKVNAILPSAGKPPLRGAREQGGFLRMGREAAPAAGPTVTFNAEQEAEYRKAREGVPQKRWWESVIDGAKALPQAFIRQFPKLGRGGFFAQASEALRHIGIFPESAANEVSRKLNQIIGSLDPAEYDLFTRAMLVDNVMWLWSNRPEMYTPDMFDEIKLPFGWNPETLETDYNATHAALEQSPKTQEAIDQMRAYWNEVRAKVRESFHKIGQSTHFLDRQGDFYMHHQILQYALEEGMWGPGGGVKAPLGRPHQRKMVGSVKAFNLQYLVTQGNVLTQLLIDANIADQIDRIIQHYDIKGDLVDNAKSRNVALMKELLATPEDPTGEQGYEEWNAPYRQKIAGATNSLVRLALGYTNKEGEVFGLPDGIWSRWEELLTDLQESYRDWEAVNAELDKEEKEPFYFDHPDWFSMLGDLLNNHGGEMGSGAAATVFKTIRERTQAKQERLKSDYVTWMDMVPDDHGLWQPAKGQMFFRVMTISDRVAQEVLEKGLAEVAGEDIKEMLAMGGPKTVTVLPGPLAETLNDAAEAMRGYQQYKFIKYNEVAVRAWKQWQLLSPRRAPRYFTRNLVGDFHKVLMGNPAALTRLPQAVGELRDVIYGGQTPGEDMRAWLNLGGISAGMFQQEIEQSEMEKLVDLLKAESVQSWMRKPTEGLPQGTKRPPALVRYFRWMRKHAQFLESMLRYSAYVEYLDQIKTNGKPSNYGASRREEIEAFRGEPNLQAYWLSNQLVGAYDQISYAGQFLRKEIVPFWSFQELNVRQHIQLLKNALQDDDFGYHISKRLLGNVALRAPYLAAKAGKWYLLAKALEIVFFTWNHMMFPDEEDDLPANVRNTPHLTFGRDSQGNIIYFNRLSVFHEFREWFGMGDSGHLTNEWLNGRMTAYQVAKEMSTSVVDKIYNSIGPWSLYGIKGATELLFRVSGFPKATRPKAIRDRTEYLMHQFGLDNEFRVLTGRPQRTPGDTPWKKYLSSIPELFVYRAEPGATAFFDNLSEKNRFFRNVLGRDEYTISWNPRTTTLLNMKRAIAYGQEEVALKYLEQYAQMPGASKGGLNSSFRQMHPLWGLSNKARREAYLEWIGPQGQEKLTMATAYYENLISEAQAVITPEVLISLGLD